MNISVIIPTLNGKTLLEQSLPHLFASLIRIPQTEVLVVDNGSQDDTQSFISSSYPQIKYYRCPTNTGFTGAINIGTQHASGDYILMLNNDCYLKKDTVDKLLQFLQSQADVVATQPIVLTPEGNIENIGYFIDLWVGKAIVFKDELKAHKVGWKQGKFDFSHRYLYGLSGTCLLIQKSVFVKLGMFDRTFHSYLEDVDLSIRMAKAGYSFVPCLESYCTHQHMATSKKLGSYKERHDFMNWIRIIIKDYPFSFTRKHFMSLLVERLRNANGVIKKILPL